MKETSERKLERYAELVSDCREGGWRCLLYPVEVGCRGFVGRSVHRLLTDLRCGVRVRRRTVEELHEAAERGSAWILRSARSAETSSA